MKTHRVAALTTAMTAAIAAAALAQTYSLPALSLDARVTPAGAGTKKTPKPAKLRLKLSIEKESRATADRLELHLPRHVRVSGRGFATCSATALDRTKDPRKCPKGSRVGSGRASAMFGRQRAPIHFRVSVFAGGDDELVFWLQSTNLPLAKAARGLVGRSGAPHHQKLTVDIPPQLQRHLGGHVHLTGFAATVGATNGRKGRRRRALVRTVGCPRDGRHRFQARVRFLPTPDSPAQGEAVDADASRCSR